MKALKWILLFSLLLPAGAFAVVKPVRILIPQINGATCPENNLCIDDEKRLNEAKALYTDALKFVQDKLGAFDTTPRVVFCSSQKCFNEFGGGKRSAVTIGSFGVVIAPKGWKYYYVRHELIHHWQAEKLGNFKFWREPDWLTEGMAYSLSGDPRKFLDQPFQTYRSSFNEWNRARGAGGLLSAMKAVQ